MATYDAPAIWTEEHYPCPDCAREGRPEPQPTDHFYYYQVKSRNRAWRRSAYCIPHMKRRDKESRKRKHDIP